MSVAQLIIDIWSLAGQINNDKTTSSNLFLYCQANPAYKQLVYSLTVKTERGADTFERSQRVLQNRIIVLVHDGHRYKDVFHGDVLNKIGCDTDGVRCNLLLGHTGAIKVFVF